MSHPTYPAGQGQHLSYQGDPLPRSFWARSEPLYRRYECENEGADECWGAITRATFYSGGFGMES